MYNIASTCVIKLDYNLSAYLHTYVNAIHNDDHVIDLWYKVLTYTFTFDYVFKLVIAQLLLVILFYFVMTCTIEH